MYNLAMDTINISYVKKSLLRRPKESSKKDYGHLLIVAGSTGMAGAAIFCGRAAIKAGVGLITYTVERGLFNIMQTAVPEAMCLPRYEYIDFNKYSAIVIGPGLGNYKEDAHLMERILLEYQGNLLIDADGLNNIIRYNLKNYIVKSKANIVFTPHEGEAARLLEISKITDRKKQLMEIIEKYNVASIIKGNETLIGEKSLDKKQKEIISLHKNITGNPGMAVGGMGDVLSGIIGALLCQNYKPIDSLKLGTFIHGLAGDYAAKKYGMISISPHDIIEMLPYVFKELYN